MGLKTLVKNISLVALVSLPIFYYREYPKTGFYCNDETIAHPYQGNTVPAKWAFSFGLSVPLVTIILVEMLVLPLITKNKSNKIDVLHIMTGYLFGAAASYSFVTISKFTIGRLRPHFLDVCRPNFEEIDCGTDTHPFFVTNYQCQGNIQLLQDSEALTHAINNAHVSFMSGHSCFSFQAATFLALYFQARKVNSNHFSLTVPTLQLICMASAFWVALTRVKDHMHHPGDVIGGSLVGTLIQIFNVVIVMRLFSSKEEDCEKVPLIRKGYTQIC